MKLFAVGCKRKVHCYVAAHTEGAGNTNTAFAAPRPLLIPILLSFLMTINEDIYSAQFGSNPQNVQVCPSATFIGVDISRLPCTDLQQMCHNKQILPNPGSFQKKSIDDEDTDELYCLPTTVNWM